MVYVQSYKDLIVWKKSIELVEEIYRLTKNFPKEELFQLTSQMRRASISIPSNIAEGYGRKSKKEYAQFYAIAYGSTLELETQLFIAKRLKFTSPTDSKQADRLLLEVVKMLYSMNNKLKNAA